MKTYDIIVLGGGPGGYVAAIKASQLGAKVALIEKEVVGGICLNHGCIPTKTLLKNAKVYKTILHAQDYGVVLGGDITFDWSLMLKRKDSVVKRLTLGVGGLLKKNGVEVFSGLGKVLSPTKVEVNGETLQTKNLILATGASPIVPPIPGLKEAYEKGIAVTSRELLQIKDAPKSLVIIGGGVIGVEFATIFSSLGTKVTIIEKLDGVLPMMDDDIRVAYTKILKRDGIEIFANAEVKAVKDHEVTYTFEGKDTTIKADTVLVSVGMRPNSNGLEALNLKMDRAAVITNEHLETSVPGVYAIGDLNGKYMLAHVASAEGIVAAEYIMGNKKAHLDYSKVPNAVYGHPEIATIGLTEREVKEKGIKYKVSTFPLQAIGKALADNEKDGMIKLIVSEQYKEILGAHIMSYDASNLIAEIGVTLELEGTAYEIAHTIHPHPTLSELVMEAAHGAVDKPIHM
ncbi:MAG: dihydrolipoyl dehydrogenase [Tenericutes bacterium HGW-Tenericutes-2]|jgi:dihydrolipoamide dehydrogenase|nr:MAG: dihydrolipoyl dehydrogenase [Tenericutes bacterium HGW-Tenericutes-2]